MQIYLEILSEKEIINDVKPVSKNKINPFLAYDIYHRR